MSDEFLIKNIAKDMFLPGSEHMVRLEQFGKTICQETLYQKRLFINKIVENFGECNIEELKSKDIELFLLKDNQHSGSWKNNFLDTFKCIYDETMWKCSRPIQCPKFQRFARQSIKPDIFTEDELNEFFNPLIWDRYEYYLLFRTMAFCGLRIGEARALQKMQFNFENDILLINGFCKPDGIKTNYNKKGSSDNQKFRCVVIPQKLTEEIKPYIKNMSDDDFIFSKNNKPFSKDALDSYFRKILRLSEIDTNNKKYIPHSLRFTYITKMRKKLSVEQVQKLAGHSSIEMTEYYTRASVADMIDMLQNLKPIINEFF